MIKKARLLLTLSLMLLTAIMPSMAFSCAGACASACAATLSQSHNTTATPKTMSACHHQGNVTAQDAPQPSVTTIDKATHCSLNMVCHLTIGINDTAVCQSLFSKPSVVAIHQSAFVAPVMLLPLDKPPRI